MSIIDAVKRLERAGAEESQMTLKLKEAANTTARLILDTVAVTEELPVAHVDAYVRDLDQAKYLELPRGYLAIHLYCDEEDGGKAEPSVQACLFISRPSDYDESDNLWQNDLTHHSVARANALDFAEDIADGLMDEIADWLEERNSKTFKAVAALKKVYGADMSSANPFQPQAYLKLSIVRAELEEKGIAYYDEDGGTKIIFNLNRLQFSVWYNDDMYKCHGGKHGEIYYSDAKVAQFIEWLRPMLDEQITEAKSRRKK